MRVLVLGGRGNFGARVVRALRADSDIEVILAGRRASSSADPRDVHSVVLDMYAGDFEARLRTLAPGLVIHCAGPFQGQDYRVARAALAAGADYLDLADGRQFVTRFAAELETHAIAAGRVAICGVSTLPALSSAAVVELRRNLSSLESIEVIIAPGQLAPRGRATLEAVFGYLGRPFAVWRDGTWKRAWGWMDLRSVRLAVGRRLAAACDVPDLALFPSAFAGVRTVTFHAALEIGVQHLVLWCLAALRRIGLPLPVTAWAVGLDRCAGLFDAMAGEEGGMCVAVTGYRDGRRVRRTWQLRVPAKDGPEIPAIPAIILARRLARGEAMKRGAFPCIGLVSLPEFTREFARWSITTRIDEVPA
jgi:saccharopine dehydrogenase-like NADP-dependent oxidoreductase